MVELESVSDASEISSSYASSVCDDFTSPTHRTLNGSTAQVDDLPEAMKNFVFDASISQIARAFISAVQPTRQDDDCDDSMPEIQSVGNSSDNGDDEVNTGRATSGTAVPTF